MKKTQRIDSIDWLRGFVMVLMALDHVRDYFSASGQNPMTDPNVAAMLFYTRWITHLCAPTFVLLAGVSAGLMAKKKTPSELSRFLFTRGIWLIFLEITVVTLGWKFNFSNSPGIILQVIWAIGVAMVFLAGLVHLPKNTVAWIGIIIIAGSNLLDGIFPPSSFSVPGEFWQGIHSQVLLLPGGISVIIAYPVLAWIGVIAAGYGLAPVFNWEAKKRQKFLITLGGGLLLLFILLRATNLYGDPQPWQVGNSLSRTIINFLNVEKYPPSLLFLSITLGLTIPLMALVEKRKLPLHNALVIVGRVPLFYYVAHIYMVHLLAVFAGMLQGFPISAWLVPIRYKPEGYGFGLPIVYMVWIGVVLMLYPACKKYNQYKSNNRDKWWLSYL
jgi:uncharacterized membrane protein